MNRNQRNHHSNFSHRGSRGGGGGGGGERDGGIGFNRHGLLGQPPGIGGMNSPQMTGGLGLLGSAPGQGMPAGNLPGPLGGGMNQNMFGPGMGGGMGPQMGMGQGGMGQGGMGQGGMGQGGMGHQHQGRGGGGGGMDQPNNQGDMNHGGQGGMNQGGGNQGMMGMQQQMAAAAMRDSQLQLVSNLIQQQGGMSSSMMGGPSQGGMMSGGPGMAGGAGLLGMGGMGMNEMGHNSERRNSGGNSIPSLFDINTKKTGLLGKRGNNNSRDRESRFSNNQNNNKRMRQNSGQSPRGYHQNRQGQQYRQSRWSDRSPTRAGGVRPRERDFRRPSSRDSKYSDRSPNSRTSRDRRESGSSSRKDVSEEYDPAQPTEEDDELDVPPLESDPEDVLIPEVTVQLNHDDDKQPKDDDVDESMEEDSKSPGLAEGGDSSLTITLRGSGRSVNDTNTEEKTEDTSPTKKSSYYCHACGVECRTEEGFAKHMNGKKHKVRMESLLTLHQEKSKQFEARIKAEEHLRKIEGKPRHERRSSGGDGGRYHQLSGRYSRENFGNTPPSGRFRQPGPTHMTPSVQRRGNQGNSGGAWLRKTSRHDLWPRCNVCSQMFKSPEKFVRHLKTPHHLENLRDRARKSSREDDEDNGFPDFGDMVTVDTIGFEDDYLSQDKSDDDQDGSDRDQKECLDKDDKEDLAHSQQVYDPDTAVGQKYIVPVSGFFCKLCHRFYNSESAAKISHCQSESHFNNFQKVMLTKILNKKNRKTRMKDEANQKPNESGENQDQKKDQSNNNQENNQSECKQDVKDIPDCPQEETDKSETTQSNGDINTEVTSQSADTEMKPKEESHNTAEIDLDTEVKLLERSSGAGSPDVVDEDSLLEGEEEEDMEADSEEPEPEPVNTKLGQRGRGGARGRARRGRRGKN